MVKIRLTRIGSKKRPYYRVMAIDSRKQRDGRPLEYLGTYDPRLNPPALNLDLDAIDGWLGKGAQLSDTVRSLVSRVRQHGNNVAPQPVWSPAAPAVVEEDSNLTAAPAAPSTPTAPTPPTTSEATTNG